MTFLCNVCLAMVDWQYGIESSFCFTNQISTLGTSTCAYCIYNVQLIIFCAFGGLPFYLGFIILVS
jgi:type III secretory pathway component EscT